MRQIWAPWRKAYILGQRRTPGCFFCQDRRSSPRKDKKNLLLYRSRHTFLVLNRYPYTNGHLMLAPNRHVPSLENLKDEERLDLFKLLDLSLKLLRKGLRPHGFNMGLNLGRIGGAGLPGHVHLHVVPRWKGDTNFMPVLTGAKVISDSLQSTYRELHRILQGMVLRGTGLRR